MRRIQTMLWSILLVAGVALLLNSCGIVSTAVEISRDVKKYPMEIALHEGETLTGEAKLPNGRTKKVTVKDENGNKTKLKSADYYINKNGVMTVKGNAISYYGLRPGDVEATFIVQQSESTLNRAARKALIAYFADDPELCNAIENKEIGPYDFDRICEEYVPESKQ